MLGGIPLSLAGTYLSLFPGVENLWMFPYSDNIPRPACEIMSLKHLYCLLKDVQLLIPFNSFSRPLFTNITHLELFFDFHQHKEKQENRAAVTGLGARPHLTHLGLNDTVLIPICVSTLEKYRSLHALFMLEIAPTNPSLDLSILAVDPRFVIAQVDSYIDDWQTGALTGKDYWARADAFIEKRISGEVDREFAVDMIRARS
jgi:hypothetical protein